MEEIVDEIHKVQNQEGCVNNSVDDRLINIKIPKRVNSRGFVRPRFYNNCCSNEEILVIPKKQKLDFHSRENVTMDGSIGKTTVDPNGSEAQDGLFASQQEYGQNFNEMSQDHDDDSVSEDQDDTEITPDDNCFNSAQSPTIYHGHTMTIFMSAVLVWTYALTHNITGSQLSDLLVLINAHCLTNIKLYDSIVSFKRYFAELKSPLVRHFYCRFCLMSVSAETVTCPNTICSKNLKENGNLAYFIEFPLIKQLHDLYKREDFYKNLKHKNLRRKLKKDGIEDIYDGEVYQNLSKPGGLLSNPDNISFSWNTDGVPVFKSSSVSIWPMYLLINELPYKERIKKSNMLFYGLWFGDVKPQINLFCSPLLKVLKELEEDGITVQSGCDIITVKAVLICGTADLPARSTAMNMVQFNGDFSCSKCVQKGRTEKIGLRGHTHIFPYCAENPVGPVRLSKDAVADGVNAANGKKAINGIKGPSFLMGLNSYDYVRSTSIDYMHCVLLGVTKKLMTLWFSVSSSSEPFSLVKQLDTVDDRLTKIKPSYHVTRKPRSIGDHLKFWKASEFRSWLLFYSVPVLKDVLPPVYFFHFCSFVQSIWILNQECILHSDIEYAYVLLNYFVLMMEPLYGARYCTLNTHNLLHLPQCVRDLGPLWVYSCFPYESLNGDLLKFFHGTQSVECQIVSAVNSHQILPDLISKLPNNMKEIAFVKKFIHSARISLGIKVDHNTYVVGGKQKIKLSAQEKMAFERKLGFSPQNQTFYARVLLRNLLLHSKKYARVQCRNSYTIKFLGENNSLCFGHVIFFAVHRHNDCHCVDICTCQNDVLACVKLLEQKNASILDTSHQDFPDYLNLRMNHIHEFSCSGKVVVIDLQKIVSICIDVSFSNDVFYICEYPNLMECDSPII